MDIKEVLNKFIYPVSPFDFSQLKKIPVKFNPQNKKKLITFFQGKVNFFRKYQNKLEKSLESLIKIAELNPDITLNSLSQADKVQNDLYTNIQNGEIVEMWSEAPIYEFLRKAEKVKKRKIDETYVRDFVDLFIEYFNKLIPIVENVTGSFKNSIKTLKQSKS